MLKFERYPHINDLIQHYINATGNKSISRIMKTGVLTEADAIKFSEFLWSMVEKINEDEEKGNIVLGSADNTDMLPDLNYEISKYMKKAGFYSVWEKISESNI
ncbi:MAG: hypothetical protein HYZ31_07065 [Gammaproteobacteria bacterium]|nr:hypothetical protein [Gammaproteobacteria bacterium]